MTKEPGIITFEQLLKHAGVPPKKRRAFHTGKRKPTKLEVERILKTYRILVGTAPRAGQKK